MKRISLSSFGFTVQKRTEVSWLSRIVAAIVSMAGAALFTGVLVSLAGVNPIQAFASIAGGAFGDWRAVSETLVKATPIMLTGLASVIAFRAQLWNIGQEGQLFAGAVASFWAYSICRGLPPVLVLVVVVLAGFIGGGIAGGIPALLYNQFNVNIIVSTVMSRYIILRFVSYLVSGPWQDPDFYDLVSPEIASPYRFPVLIPESRLHIGFLIALAAMLGLEFLLRRTPYGYEVRAYGSNARASKAKGINPAAVVLKTMIISGGLAGLAGASEIFGIQYRLRMNISPGYGNMGIIVAMLAGLSPLVVFPAATLFGGLINGCVRLRVLSGIPTALAFAIESVVLLFLVVGQVVSKYRIERVRHANTLPPVGDHYQRSGVDP
jgi:ABC-type uncharacterized transport system permease subunit